MALTKAELSEKLYEELGINRREAREFIDLFFNEIIDCLSDGYDVKISGFGKFILRNKSARPGRNPKFQAKDTLLLERSASYVTLKPMC